MAAPRKSILVAGLGKFISADPDAEAKFGNHEAALQKLEALIETAREAGFDCTTFHVNPNDPQDSLARLTDILKAQKWDGFLIGFGVRGNKDFTALFEQIVNLSVEISPSTRFGFSQAPDAVWDTIQRIFPAGQE